MLNVDSIHISTPSTNQQSYLKASHQNIVTITIYLKTIQGNNGRQRKIVTLDVLFLLC